MRKDTTKQLINEEYLLQANDEVFLQDLLFCMTRSQKNCDWGVARKIILRLILIGNINVMFFQLHPRFFNFLYPDEVKDIQESGETNSVKIIDGRIRVPLKFELHNAAWLSPSFKDIQRGKKYFGCA